jgi:serine/threonine protein kinase
MLQVGQVIGDRYRLQQKLGRSVGHQTWLAEDQVIQPPELVVIKFLTFGGDMQWDDLRLFEREAQVLRQLNHPKIPKYRDYFSIDDRTLWFGLVQNYIPGASLKELLNQGKRFTEQEVRQMAIEVLQILSYLHELHPPILHRDIKPSNLILSNENQIYLIDFGSVQDRLAKEGATFTIVGTYGYTPIEQFGGRAVPASDLYALGATLIHLLTGVAPADLPQQDFRIQFSDRLTLNPHFCHWLDTLIEPDLKRRFSTAQQALESLEGDRINTPKLHQSSVSEVAASYNEKLDRPQNTRIEIHRSSDNLFIQIPVKLKGRKEGQFRYVLYVLYALIIWISLVSKSFPNLVFFLGVLLFIEVIISLWNLSPSISSLIRFDRDQFQITHDTSTSNSILEQLGSTPSIMDIVIQPTYLPRVFRLKIVTLTRDYSVALCHLKQAERLWLVAEIKDWLGLQ